VDNQIDNIVISLAGMLQVVTLILELTQTGKMNEHAFEASVHSIFQLDPIDVVSVYKDLSHLKLGLQTVVTAFNPLFTGDKIVNRYLLSLIHLQKKLNHAPRLLATLRARLEQTKKQVAYFSLLHPTVISNLSDIYTQTISTFKFRVMILGNPRILNAKENMEKVRTLLLAGIRSATLWRQSGGSRTQMLFMRHKIKLTAEKLLTQLT
jgi:high frequency lysogenization protein